MTQIAYTNFYKIYVNLHKTTVFCMIHTDLYQIVLYGTSPIVWDSA